MEPTEDPVRAEVYALSLKQPWAALLVHGLKTIEVRTWSTFRRGRILIHASRTEDTRPEVWDLVPSELRSSARQRGGIIGCGELTGCLQYKTAEQFATDQSKHR